MRSFALLVASLSFGALSWAAPTPQTLAQTGDNTFLNPDSPTITQETGDNTFMNGSPSGGKTMPSFPGIPRDGSGSLIEVGNVLDHDNILNGVSVLGGEIHRRGGESLVGVHDVLNKDNILNGVSVLGGEVKRGGDDTLETILEGLLNDLKPLTDKLLYITSEDCTVEIVSSIVNEIVELIEEVITALLCLVGKDVKVILATVDGLLTSLELGKLIAEILNLVFCAIAAVLKIVGGVTNDIFPLLCLIVAVIGKLLTVILSLVDAVLDDLVKCIVAEIGGIVETILCFVGYDIIKILCLV